MNLINNVNMIAILYSLYCIGYIVFLCYAISDSLSHELKPRLHARLSRSCFHTRVFFKQTDLFRLYKENCELTNIFAIHDLKSFTCKLR